MNLWKCRLPCIAHFLAWLYDTIRILCFYILSTFKHLIFCYFYSWPSHWVAGESLKLSGEKTRARPSLWRVCRCNKPRHYRHLLPVNLLPVQWMRIGTVHLSSVFNMPINLCEWSHSHNGWELVQFISFQFSIWPLICANGPTPTMDGPN